MKLIEGIAQSVQGPQSTLMRFQKYAFSLSSETHRSIRVHTTFLMRFRLSTLKRSKTIELHVVTSFDLYAHATHALAIFSVIVFIQMHFRPSTFLRYVCVFVLIHFQLTTPENAITYNNTVCSSPENFKQVLSSASLGS